MKKILLSFIIGGITGGVSSHYMIKESEGGFLLSIIVGLITILNIPTERSIDYVVFKIAVLLSAFVGFLSVGMITWYCK
ncbi:MAG: hypothetical protein ACI351_05190 [Candidatus Avelusimicrobium sp.]|uniref:hypothetical protein n=1 Tax=Candidatus Avelusimicrobium sp. TaxID=3048833 RepID=UPI003F023A42